MAESPLPNYKEVQHTLDTVSKKYPDICKVTTLGTSIMGREIRCAVLTSPSVHEEEKQHLLVVAGTHGSEESGRAIALELIEFLVSNDPLARETLMNQEVAVIPCANPDGAVHNTYRNAEDVDIAHTFALGQEAGTPEGRAIEEFALEFAPEVNVDIHGLAGGSMKDRIWFRSPLNFTPDPYYLTVMGIAMSEAGEQAGFPQCEIKPPPPFPETGADSLGHKLAAEVKSMPIGLETIEHYYTEPEWRADGIARLKRLLQFGNEDAFALGEPGYPASVVSGSRVQGLKSYGTTAAERRHSRIDLTAFLRNNFAVVDREADGIEKCAKVKVVSETIEGPNPVGFTIMLRFRKPCKIKSVLWKGKKLKESNIHGYIQREDDNSVLLDVYLNVPFGGPERFLTVRYECPFF